MNNNSNDMHISVEKQLQGVYIPFLCEMSKSLRLSVIHVV